MRWTEREIAYLVKHANEGAKAVAAHLGRSVVSVQVQASRYGVSLRIWHLCPHCGNKTYGPLSPVTGWCRACSLTVSRDKASEKNREVRREIERERSRIRKAARERQATYSDTNRRNTELRRLREK